MWHWLGSRQPEWRRRRDRFARLARRDSRGRWLISSAIAVSLLAVLSVVWFAGGLSGEAVHGTHYFEVEGDILDTPAGGAPDWGSIFDANGDIVDLAGGVEAAFLMDDISPQGATDDTSFEGSGSSSNKNNDPVSTWNWSTGQVLAKDDLSNVYAFGILNGNGDLVLYAGLERIAADGDSHVDLEFNKNEISLDKTPPCGDDLSGGPGDTKPCEFVGEKSVGDVLVAMDFENGGALGKLRV